ncbi:MAG: GNAT family N-acetyltransferase [Acidobacteriota bacterium]
MIRRFEFHDRTATARVWHRSGGDEYDYLPMFQALDEKSALELFETLIVKTCDVWVYETGSEIRGFLAMKNSYIDRLYVDPAHQRSGIGSALLGQAKALSPTGLQLHTHQRNERARRFYEKSGFVAVKFGLSPLPESLPDVEYHWSHQGDP